MKQLILLFTGCFLFVLKTNAQDDFAVIRDNDRFTNIRESTLQSKIIGKILKYQIFDCYTDSEDKHRIDYPNMINISYSKYANQKGENYQRNVINNDGWDETGYIHKSRVYKLSQMPRLKLKTLSDSTALFVNDSIQVTFTTAKFNPSKHRLKDYEGRLITDTSLDKLYGLSYVDGKRIWGFISEYHSNEITSITVSYNKKDYALPADSFKNIFAPNFEDFTNICIGLDGELYIWMINGDGAESYNVIWVIVDGKLKYMYLDLSYYV